MNKPVEDSPSPSNACTSDSSTFSVGRVAEMTGIAPATLRIWERRYGVPEPVRLPSGHRRYTADQVRWLRRVAEALALGARPGTILRGTEQELERYLQGGEDAITPEEVRTWIDAILRFDADSLMDGLTTEMQEGDIAAVLENKVGPLLTAIGRAWVDGELGIRHEHFATRIIENVLRNVRVSIEERETPAASTGPVLLATLPNERHGLGLDLVELCCAIQGVSTRNIGTDLPVDEIALAARELDAVAVVLSVSSANAGVSTDAMMAELMKTLPENVPLLAGGSGVRRGRRGPRGLVVVQTLRDLRRWLEKNVKRNASRAS